jgi:hypothetical protein
MALRGLEIAAPIYRGHGGAQPVYAFSSNCRSDPQDRFIHKTDLFSTGIGELSTSKRPKQQKGYFFIEVTFLRLPISGRLGVGGNIA